VSLTAVSVIAFTYDLAFVYKHGTDLRIRACRTEAKRGKFEGSPHEDFFTFYHLLSLYLLGK